MPTTAQASAATPANSSANAPAQTQTPQQRREARERESQELDARINDIQTDDLDTWIGQGIQTVLQNASEDIPQARYGTHNREGTFVVSIDGMPVPLRFNINIGVDLWVESNEEYPLAVREYVTQVQNELQNKARVLSDHLKRRYLTQLKREIVTHSFEDVLRTNGVSSDMLERMRTDGVFDTVVEATLRRMEQNEARAVEQDRVRREREQAERATRREEDQVLRAEPVPRIQINGQDMVSRYVNETTLEVVAPGEAFNEAPETPPTPPPTPTDNPVMRG